MKTLFFSMLLCFAFATTIAQPPNIIIVGDIISASLPLKEINQSCDIYKIENNASMKLAHTPFFAFQSSADGKIVATINKLTEEKSEVVLRLLNSPVDLKLKLATYVKKEAIKKNDANLKNISDSDIITPIFLNFSIKDNTKGSSIGFLEVKEIQHNAQPVIEVKSQPLSVKECENLIADLHSGKRQFAFLLTYDLAAKFMVSESSAQFEVANIKESEIYKALSGSAGAYRWSKNKTETITKDATTVTRQQKDNIKATLRSEMAAKYNVENNDDLIFLDKKIDEFMNSIFSDIKVPIEADFSQELNRLMIFDGGLADDLKPDEINSIMSKIKEYLLNEGIHKLDIGVKIKGDFLGLLSADNDYKFTKEDFVKKAIDNGWEIEQKGNIYIPKSISLSAINYANLNRFVYMAVKISRFNRNSFKQVISISTSQNLYYPESNTFENLYSTIMLNSCPIGTILPFGGNYDKIPNGWKLCDGERLKKEGNEELFNVIGNNWGGRDGLFDLPDLRGAFIRGVDYARRFDVDRDNKNKNSVVGDYQSDEFASHDHGIDNNNSATRKRESVDSGSGAIVNGDEFHNAPLRILPNGGSETRPKNYTVNFIIRCN